MGPQDKGVRAQCVWRMQQGDGGSSENNGGRKRDQLSHTSSLREKRQINSRRIDSPIIIGPQHRLHLGMATSFRRCQEPQTAGPADQSFIHWADPKILFCNLYLFWSCNWNEIKWTLLKKRCSECWDYSFFPTYPTAIIAQLGNGKMPMDPIQ